MWADVLETGHQHDDYRFRRAAYLRLGFGVGHEHIVLVPGKNRSAKASRTLPSPNLKFPPEESEVLLYFPAFRLGSGVVALPTGGWTGAG